MNEELRRMELMNESLLEYYQRACGWTFWPIILVGLAAIVVATAVVIRGRGATVGPALVLSVLITPLLGLFSSFDGLLLTFRIIEQSGTAPDPRSLHSAYAMALVPPCLGLMMSLPTVLIALVGATIRSFTAPKNATLP